MKITIDNDRLIIITGAAGFIGSGVIRDLNDKGYYRLLLVDDFEQSIKWMNLCNKRFLHLISYERIFDFLANCKEDIGAIIHLGACSNTLEANEDYLVKTNYWFSVQLAEYALKRDCRFIYASSAATYGDGALGFVDDESSLNDLVPLNIYGFSKHMFDKWLQDQGVLNKVVGLKYFNIFGPNEYHKGKMGSMVMQMVDQIEQRGTIRLFRSSDQNKYQDGNQCRDFYYVKDAVKMTTFFLDYPIYGLFNVGSGRTNTWNAMAKNVFKVLGKATNIEYIPIPDHLCNKYQNYTCADMSKFHNIKKEKNISFNNDYTFESAIEEYITHYLVKDKRW